MEHENNSEEGTVDIYTYLPKAEEEVVYLDTLMPTEDSQAEISCNVMATPRGIIIVNIAHKRFPDTEIQVQLCPNTDHLSTTESLAFVKQLSDSNTFVPTNECIGIAAEVCRSVSLIPDIRYKLELARCGFN